LRREGDVSGEGSQLGALEISFGFFHRKKIPGRELVANSEVIILDTVDGKTLPGYDPFCLVIEMRHGRRLLFRHVRRLSVRPSA
jgi:hypothetical protein